MASIVVRFIGEFASINRAVQQVEGTSGRMKKWAAGVAGAIGSIATIDFAKKAVEGAQALESAGARVSRTFGPAAKSVDEFAKGSVKAFGETETAVLGFANSFGTVLTGFGIAQPKAAEMSKTLTTLAANLAARKGVPMSDAVNALTRAVAGGKAAALKTFGISIDNTAIQMEALRSGLVKAPPNMAAVQLAAEKLALAHDKATLAIKKYGPQSGQARAALIAQQGAQNNLDKALASGKVTLTAAQKAQAAYNLVTKQGASARGAAAKALQTSAGQEKQFRAAVEEAQVALGRLLLPVLRAVIPVLTRMADFFTRNRDVILPIVGAITALVVAFKTYKVVQSAITAAQTLWNAALVAYEAAQGAASIAAAIFNAVLDANPILLIVVAIAALVAGVIYAYTHFKVFRDVVQAVWNAIQVGVQWVIAHWPLLLAVMLGPFGILLAVVIKNFSTILGIIESVFNWIVGHWQLLVIVLTGPIGLALVLIVRNFSLIKAAASALWQAIVFVWGLITAVFNAAVKTWGAVMHSLAAVIGLLGSAAKTAYDTISRWIGAIPKLISSIVGEVEKAAEKIADAIKGPINLVIRAWNDLELPAVHVSAFGLHFDSAPIGLPNLPLLASGGIVERATLAIIGERGPEAVIPLDRLGATSANTYNIAVEVATGADPVRVGRSIVEAITAYEHANGTRWRGVA